MGCCARGTRSKAVPHDRRRPAEDGSRSDTSLTPDGSLIDLDGPVAHARDRELVPRAPLSGCAEGAPLHRVFEESVQCSGHAGCIARFDEEPGRAVDDDLRHRADPRRDDWEAGEHRFEQHDAESLPARGVDEEVGPPKPRGRFDAPRKEHRLVEPEPVTLRLRSAPRAPPEDREPDLRVAARARGRTPRAALRGPSARSTVRSRARAERPPGCLPPRASAPTVRSERHRARSGP